MGKKCFHPPIIKPRQRPPWPPGLPAFQEPTIPVAPPRACARCGHPAPKGHPCACRPPWEHSTHPGGKTDMRMRRTLDAYRRAHPYCQAPGCRRLMTQVDHIVPLAEGGDRYNWDNLQSLCQPHHDQKTTQDALRGKKRAR